MTMFAEERAGREERIADERGSSSEREADVDEAQGPAAVVAVADERDEDGERDEVRSEEEGGEMSSTSLRTVSLTVAGAGSSSSLRAAGAGRRGRKAVEGEVKAWNSNWCER